MAENKNNEAEELEVQGVEVEESASEQFVENNAKKLGIIAGVAIVAIIGIVYYFNMSASSEAEDQKAIYPAQYYFGSDSLNLALFGDSTGDFSGFDELREELQTSKVKNLNYFYIGAINLQNGDFEVAIEYLEDFSSSSDLVQARANALLGDAYMELAEVEPSNYSSAISNYEKAATTGVNSAFTPGYLLKLALAYELNGQDGDAISTYDKVIDNYASGQEVLDAKKYKAVLEAKKNS